MEASNFLESRPETEQGHLHPQKSIVLHLVRNRHLKLVYQKYSIPILQPYIPRKKIIVD